MSIEIPFKQSPFLFGCLLFLFHFNLQADPAQNNLQKFIVQPYVWMWGYRDGNQEKMINQGIFSMVNILDGKTKDFQFVKQLEDKQILFAYDTSLSIDKTEDQIYEELTVPFRIDTGSSLPGGFKAISIDELNAFQNGSEKAVKIIRVLKRIKDAYPQKLILAAGTYKMGLSGMPFRIDIPNCSDIMKAINDYVDLFGLEFYMREGNNNLLTMESIPVHLNGKYPGILDKTIFLTGISQQGYVFDDDYKKRFNSLLESQFQMIKNNQYAQKMPGIGFWVYYRSYYPTILKLEQLISKYFRNEKIPANEMIDLSSILENGSFEDGSGGWEFKGTSKIIPYSSLDTSITNYHGYTENGMFGKYCVIMNYENSADTITQAINLKGRRKYFLSFFIRPITISSMNEDEAITVTIVSQVDMQQQIIHNDSIHLMATEGEWKRVFVEFNVEVECNLKIIISNEKMEKKESMILDFAELDFIEN